MLFLKRFFHNAWHQLEVVLRILPHSFFVILEKLEYNFFRKIKIFFHGPVPLFFGMSFFYSAGIQGSVKSIVSGMDKTKRENRKILTMKKQKKLFK